MCGVDDWIVNDRVFELREFRFGGLTIGGDNTVYPAVPVGCRNCGNTLLISAVFSGVIADLSPQGKKS
jgi:hypothetical protein